MGKPPRKDIRTAILGGFDRKPICTINDITNHLKEKEFTHTYHATRRMLIKMCNEGLIYELPKRGDRNQVFYTKAMFNNTIRLMNADGENVSLRAFVHCLINETKPDIISADALVAIKAWMLDVLGSTIPVAYDAKSRDIPDEYELRKKLEQSLSMLSYWHTFIKSFLKADVWSEHSRDKIAKEFQAGLIEEHSIIVDRSWVDNGDSK